MTPETLKRLSDADPALARRGALVDGVIQVDVGAEPWYLTVERGAIRAAGTRPPAGPVRLRLSAPRAEWEAFWEPRPRPGHHDVMALMRRRVLTVEGDLHLFMAHLRYVKDLLEKPRSAA
ncbi:SCP2 sterol-binding domain-containing protein [Cryptosporangium aurantiacum]|uniref:SCP-2 sterol transfer family protein n=1 Tax=Cryptosporangium aurantiacum TaxID=134849 RepID=A0A1M7R470_9ACTN|nr:SCP2 sterol-binding domain-containing protein [Cryptosporangium aurantiacum]SHN39764.1 SCP-2 sterol transfer family protein [Cryptosporangium aurantiacum]